MMGGTLIVAPGRENKLPTASLWSIDVVVRLLFCVRCLCWYEALVGTRRPRSASKDSK